MNVQASKLLLLRGGKAATAPKIGSVAEVTKPVKN